MGSLLFKLSSVPQQEADAVRQLLDAADIAYYETSAGNWGVSLAAIWLVHPADQTRAQVLLDEYQVTLAERVRADLDEQGVESLLQRFARQPLKFLGALAVVAFILYLSVMPFTAAWS